MMETAKIFKNIKMLLSLLLAAMALLTAAPALAAAEPADTTAPRISDVKISATTFDSATISWTTSEPATSEVVYGISTEYGGSAADKNRSTDHSIVIKSASVVPATTYHFMIRSVDAAGNAATSNDNTFTTMGATINARVVNSSNNKAVKGAQVEVDGKSTKTGSNGVASITGIGLGRKYGVITYKGHKFPIDLTVKDATHPMETTFTIKVPTDYVTPIIIIVLLLIIAAYLLGRGRGQGPTKSTLIGQGTKI